MDAGPSFLSRNDEDPQEDRAELPPPHAHHTPFPMYPQMIQTQKPDIFSSVQWHMILLGVIVGYLLASMSRPPIIIKGTM